MMSNVFKLIKVGLLTTFRGQVGKKRKIQKPLIGVLILIAFLPLVFSMSEVIRFMYGQLELFGQGDSILAIGMLIASMVVFIFGIFYTIGSYYMASDIPTYLQLPLRPWEISTSRFFMVLLYEYLTMLIFLAPLLIGYGMAAGPGIGFYVTAVPVFLFLPILPLTVASIIVICLMSFAKRAINKDRFTMIASLLGLLIGIGFNFGFQTLIGSMEQGEALQEMLMTGQLDLAQKIARYFPGIANATKALADTNVLQLLIFIAVAAIAFVLFILVANALYFRGVLGLSQQVSRRDFNAEKAGGFVSRSPLGTYLSKELKLIFRTPIFFMNLVLIDILLPVFMLVPIFISLGADEFMAIKDQLMSSAPEGILLTGSFIIFLFISAMNGITATSISREGKQLYMMKYLPLSYREQLNAKMLSGMVVSLTGMSLMIILLTVLLELSLPLAFLMLLAGVNAVTMTRITGMFIDASKPKLKWDNEVKAVKQNTNLVLNMLAGIAMAAVAVIFLIFVSTSLLVNGLVFILGMAVINFLLYKLLQKKFPGMIERIE